MKSQPQRWRRDNRTRWHPVVQPVAISQYSTDRDRRTLMVRGHPRPGALGQLVDFVSPFFLSDLVSGLRPARAISQSLPKRSRHCSIMDLRWSLETVTASLEVISRRSWYYTFKNLTRYLPANKSFLHEFDSRKLVNNFHDRVLSTLT